ncbi:MAG: PAS domain S-box protein [Candidatus Cloacimonetes bacterium]|nr:PAS domain S-box protein [Candidatus Cloacimonadota bacterium]
MDWKKYIEDFYSNLVCADDTLRPKLIQDLSGKLVQLEQAATERDMYRSILENASDTIVEMDEKGKILYSTPNWIRQLGHQSDQMIGKVIFDTLFHPEDAQKAKKYLKEAFRSKKTQTGFEYRIKNSHGEYRWHTANLSPLFDEENRVKSVIAVAHSIHDRKTAELKLQEREKLYRLLLNTMREAVIMVDNDDYIKYVNPSWCELFGYSSEEALGKTGFELVVIADDQHIIRKKNLERQSGKVDEYILRGKKKNGSLIWLRISGAPVQDEFGTVIGSVGIMTDITESKKALDSLARSEEKYRDLFENSMAGVFQSTLDDQYISVNRHFAQMFGYSSPTEMVQSVKDIKDLYVHPEDRIKLKELLLQNGIVENYEVELKRKDGSRLLTLLSARISTNNDGISVIEGANIDITELRILQDQLLGSQKMEAIGKLAGGVAHDFNNLLTIILGYSEDLLEELPKHSPLRELADEILKAGMRAARLTRELLAFSKKQIIANRDLDLNSLINNLKGIITRMLGEEVALSFVLAEDLKTVKADPTQMEQVIVNLVINAKEAMPTGGVFRIRTQNETIKLNSPYRKLELPAGEYVLLNLKDTGCGIDFEIQDKIFEPFFSTKSEARGLGLSTVWGIVQQMGGAIFLDSKPDKGTEINIFLPVSEGMKDSASFHLVKPDHGKNEQILVVEDEETLCLLIKKMLTNMGYQVIATTKASEALAQIKEGIVPDLLLTDVVMPNMNGMQLVEEVRKVQADQKVLLMSGFTDDIIIQQGGGKQNYPFIAKPFTASQIAPVIRDILKLNEFEYHLLILASDNNMQQLMQRSCRKRKLDCKFVCSSQEAIDQLRKNNFHVIVADLSENPSEVILTLQKTRERGYDLPVIAIADMIKDEFMDELKKLKVLHAVEKSLDSSSLIDFIVQTLKKELR